MHPYQLAKQNEMKSEPSGFYLSTLHIKLKLHASSHCPSKGPCPERDPNLSQLVSQGSALKVPLNPVNNILSNS